MMLAWSLLIFFVCLKQSLNVVSEFQIVLALLSSIGIRPGPFACYRQVLYHQALALGFFFFPFSSSTQVPVLLVYV